MAERLQEVVGQLVSGWFEKIEYRVVIGEVSEKRVERRWQKSLIHQLQAAQYLVPCKGSDGSGGGGASNKPASKTPGNLEQPDEILHSIECAALELADQHGLHVTSGRRLKSETLILVLRALADLDLGQDDHDDAAHRLTRPVRQARLLLGYDSRLVMFEGTVCSQCGGALAVQRDMPSAVRCAGTPAAPPCGTTYPWWTWPELAETIGARLADTTTAVAWIGRPREVLYRWAREGRVTRHGGSGRNDARWNLAELPRAIPGQPLPDPPAKKILNGMLDKAAKS